MIEGFGHLAPTGLPVVCRKLGWHRNEKHGAVNAPHSGKLRKTRVRCFSRVGLGTKGEGIKGLRVQRRESQTQTKPRKL